MISPCASNEEALLNPGAEALCVQYDRLLAAIDRAPAELKEEATAALSVLDSLCREATRWPAARDDLAAMLDHDNALLAAGNALARLS